MKSFMYKNVENSDFASDRYICVNNFGYYQDIDRMELHREKGRRDYQLIYVKKGEITVLENRGNNEYVVDYNGVKCTAIYNWFSCAYYADDIYGKIKGD